MTWLLGLGMVLCLAAVAAVGACAYGTQRWNDSTRTLTGRVEAGRISEKDQPPSGTRFVACDPRLKSDERFQRFRIVRSRLRFRRCRRGWGGSRFRG